MTLLLDTCTFLWMADEQHRLSDKVRDMLENASNTLCLHQATAWEIQIKHSLGKLALPQPPRIAVPAAIAALGLDYHRLDDDTIYTLEKLPALHRDPFDRLLIAHAIHHGLPLLTPDPLIHPYPIRVIW